ncbi:uncharacterized protein DFL_000898 [Arthrobotrys flagrans]|uniref:Helicase ATP-binding domain-containing protein n=1 Tax=Arthrobotrys flagrans TaxID=97331 RepID=A0A437AFD3_ARTFL|nr:hypothetical protein DFL_000898 [Arthrobotrys flagrans]
MRRSLSLARALIAPRHGHLDPPYFLPRATTQWSVLRYKTTKAKAKAKAKATAGTDEALPPKPRKPRKPKLKAVITPPPSSSAAELTPSQFVLRDYQEECIQAVLEHQEKGHRRLGISLATGSGKTVIFTQLIDRIPPLRPEATQTLILVHRRELVEQAATHCRNCYPDKTVEVEMGNHHASGTADITVASIQSISSSGRIGKFKPELHKLILIDEAHHAVAKSYRKTLEHFGAMTAETDVYVVGVSATFGRSDGLRLGAVMDHIVYHKDFVSMIDSGWLSKVLFTTVKSNINYTNVKLTGATGDFNLSDLANAVNTPENNDVTVRSWIEKAGNRKSTLVFCVDIKHVIDMTNLYRRYGYEAFYVTGETPLQERAKILDDFRAGKFPVLVNCGVFTEGTDIPNIDCVLLSRPTRSRTLLVQMIGRGMRLHPGKEDCHVIDVVGSVSRGVLTTPTLFGLPPEEVLDRASSSVVKNKFELQQGSQNELERQQSEKSQISSDVDLENEIDPEIYSRPWTVTFVDYDSIHDLVQDSRADASVRQYSLNAWVWVGPGKYVLGLVDNSYVSVQAKPEGGFFAQETRALPEGLRGKYGTPFMRPRVVVDHVNTLEEIINAADTFVTGRYPRQLISHAAPWRKADASDGQLEFLSKRTKKSVEEYRQEGLTKGQAADMLTRFKHGAAGLFEKLEKMKRKETRKELKAIKMSTPMSETVKVGKLDADA